MIIFFFFKKKKWKKKKRHETKSIMHESVQITVTYMYGFFRAVMFGKQYLGICN